MAERLSAFVNGVPIFFIGVIVVFAMLLLLIAFMLLLGYIMDHVTSKQKESKRVEAEVVKAIEEVAPTADENIQDDLELVAVITAAIAASLETTSDRLQVRSLRKIQRKSL